MRAIPLLALGIAGLLAAPFLSTAICLFAQSRGIDCSPFMIIFYGIPFICILYPAVMNLVEKLEK
ncbi:MAG: hypothetical protein ABH829_02625 [archaeon]